jgi:hypothetical protein
VAGTGPPAARGCLMGQRPGAIDTEPPYTSGRDRVVSSVLDGDAYAQAAIPQSRQTGSVVRASAVYGLVIDRARLRRLPVRHASTRSRRARYLRVQCIRAANG